MRRNRDQLTAAEQQILEDVEQQGVHVVEVAGDATRPDYAFSIGLWHSFGHAEVVVCGLPTEVARQLIDLVADEVAEDRNFGAGDEVPDLLHGYPMRVVAVDAARHPQWFERAVWAYDGAAFPVVQLVYPDKQGRWPWHPGVRDGFVRVQPLLGEPSEA